MAYRYSASLIVALITVIVSLPGCAPSGPTCVDEAGRSGTGLLVDQARCTTVGSQLQCVTVAHTSGPYDYCPKSEDVTRSAMWIVGDSTILRMTAPGVFEAIGIGDTFIKARWKAFETVVTPVSVFVGMPPMQTAQISGGVYRTGQRTFAGAIDGAFVEILTGLVGGKSAVTGILPKPMPGFIVGTLISPGYFIILGVPAGTYRLRASKAGFAPSEREVTVHEGYSGGVDFELTPE